MLPQVINAAGKNTGKNSEDIFQTFMEGQGAHVYRFEDYAEANFGNARQKRKIVSSKPSDFITTLHGITAFTEVKSISKGTRFDFSRIEKRQWREAVKVTKAYGRYYFYLHFLESDRWYAVPAALILMMEKKSVQEKDVSEYECLLNVQGQPAVAGLN